MRGAGAAKNRAMKRGPWSPDRPPWYERVHTRLGLPMLVLMIVSTILAIWRG